MDIKHYSKIDHKTLHFLPFLPSRKRAKGFSLTRQWGNHELFISAMETLNTYDLLTLLYMVKEYIINGYQAGYIGEGDDKKEVAGIDIDVKKFLLMRGILNKKPNRETLKKSIMRLKTINLIFTNLKNGNERHTSYIYEFTVKDDGKQIRIFANKAFIEFVISNGILINLERLKLYGNKEQYALLLDLYLQGTKIPYKRGNKTYYKYRDRFKFAEIEQAMKLDVTSMRHADKLDKMREAFSTLKDKGGMPLYSYSKSEKFWIKTE